MLYCHTDCLIWITEKEFCVDVYLNGEMVHINVVLVLSLLLKSVSTEYFDCVHFTLLASFSLECIVQFVICWILWLEFLQKSLLPMYNFFIVLRDVLVDIYCLVTHYLCIAWYLSVDLFSLWVVSVKCWFSLLMLLTVALIMFYFVVILSLESPIASHWSWIRCDKYTYQCRMQIPDISTKLLLTLIEWQCSPLKTVSNYFAKYCRS